MKSEATKTIYFRRRRLLRFARNDDAAIFNTFVLIAVYIIIFGIGFYLIYRKPLQNRQITLLGILMKTGYILVVLGHFVFGSIPLPFILLTLAVLDFIFIPFFIAAYLALDKMAP